VYNHALTQDAEYPDKPAIDDVELKDTVGINLSITNFIHDSENRTSARTRKSSESALRDETARSPESNTIQLSGIQQDSDMHERLKNRRENYREKRAHWYARKYGTVFAEEFEI
jgi:putative transposase